MISLLDLNKLIKIIIFFTILIFNTAVAIAAVNIWEKKENQSGQDDQISDEKKYWNEKKISIESPILSDDVDKITIEIDEQKISKFNQTIIGIFDPEEGNFNLDMWAASDGEDIKSILKKINKLNLSRFSEDLLFQVLFTNAYPPKNNLTSDEFLKIKIDWLIKNQRIQDLETLLQINPEVGKEPKVIKLLINEYLSSTNIKSACEKINFVNKDTQNDYFDKFKIYCLISDGRKDEAQLILDLLKEQGFKDEFFEDKMSFLLGLKETTSQEILDNNLLNFYLSHITSDDFYYKPDEKTDRYIWRYLASVNLINTNDFENEDEILTYEKAAAVNSFENKEIFNIYKQIFFNIDQLVNATEVYKNLPSYKARALIYQKILLSNNIEKKLYLTFLLRELFIKDKLFNVYSEELSNILTAIEPNEVPENYRELVKRHLRQNFKTAKNIKFNNNILHRSKVLKHFLDNKEEISRTERDFKAVYNKMKNNKRYFYSTEDIIVLESLKVDGISLPAELDYIRFSSKLTVPKNLKDLANQNQVGLAVLTIIEMIGEDNIRDLKSETIFFLNKILNDLNLKKIRNNILSEVLPVRI